MVFIFCAEQLEYWFEIELSTALRFQIITIHIIIFDVISKHAIKLGFRILFDIIEMVKFSTIFTIQKNEEHMAYGLIDT